MTTNASEHIVVLDGHTLNPGDLSWSDLEPLGSLDVYERTSPAEVHKRASQATALLTNKVVLDRSLLEQLPSLRYVGVTATGFNIIDVDAARERGIVVTNAPAYSTDSVVQLTFALLFELTHQVGLHAEAVKGGKWAASPDFSFTESPLVEVANRTFGIVGYGTIGRAVARAARAFGMHVLAHTRTVPSTSDSGVEFVDLETLFRRSDVISLHCPLTPETRHLVNRDRIEWMRSEAYLLNTGRGPLVDETALAEALEAGRIAGAGVDVLSTEPPSSDNPLPRAPRCVITPHLGWATVAARRRLMRIVVENLQAFLDGQPINVVNGPFPPTS